MPPWDIFSPTAGWEGNFWIDTGHGDDARARYVAEMNKVPQLTRPGETYVYCNSGFALAGRIIEVVTGLTFEVAMHELVIAPLDLQHTFYFPGEVMMRRFAVGHNVSPETVEVTGPWMIPRNRHRAVGVASSVLDQLRYARFHLSEKEGRRVLAPVSLRTMHTPVCNAEFGTQRALAWGVRQTDDVQVGFHDGDTRGQYASLYLAPNAGFAIPVLTNSNWSTLKQTIVAEALRTYLGVADRPPQPIHVPDADEARVIGRHTGQIAAIELRRNNGALTFSWVPETSIGMSSESSPVAFCATDCLVLLETGATADLLRDATGDVVWVRFWGSLYRHVVP